MTPEERLDRIERLVGANAQAIAENTNAIANLRETMQQGFTETRTQIEQSSSFLVGVIGDFVEEMQQDRETIRDVVQVIRDMQVDVREMQTDIREMQTEVRGLQVENQRILRHLFGEEQQ